MAQGRGLDSSRPLVACVYRPGNGFTDEYVFRLRDAVATHCRAAHRFVCLTNKSLSGIETIPLRGNAPGWWSKIELFHLLGPVVYLDLDTMLVNDITDIVVYPHEITVGTNWKHPESIASGFMAWGAGVDLRHMAVPYSKETGRRYSMGWERWGDQGFIQDHLQRSFARLDDIFPGRAVSYKYHVRDQGAVPPGASIVMFHARPRPHEINWRLPCTLATQR